MHSAFKDLATFLSAWAIYYISVRTSLQPRTRSGSGLLGRKGCAYEQSGFAWPAVLNYVIPTSPTTKIHLLKNGTVSTTNSLRSTSPARCNTSSSTQPRSPGKKSKFGSTFTSVPIQKPTCANWNRPNVGCSYEERYGKSCPHKHRCMICSNPSLCCARGSSLCCARGSCKYVCGGMTCHRNRQSCPRNRQAD